MTISTFQRAAKQQGDRFAEVSKDALIYAGFEIKHERYNFDDIGVEIDIMATNRHQIDFLFECKGSMRGERPGLVRTDTTKKAIANAVLIHWSEYRAYFPPLIILASHVPQNGAALAMLNMCPIEIMLDVLNPYNHGKYLQQWANADERWIENYIRHQEGLAARLSAIWFC